MKRLIAAVFVLFGLAVPALACPTFDTTGATYTLTGDQLYSPQSYSVVAGGPNQLRNCGFQYSGSVISSPDFSFYLSGMDNYRLEIEVTSACDTVLLVNSANTTWFFDDDSRGNLDPVINIRGGEHLNGRVDVWVGTYNGDYCDATLEMETWNN
ncbi:hypothetical protein GTA62_12885 [Roseobacter sp. HKCCD9010]|jgi:hypothetical protein|uniref:hypothetical protein n=1 Tax=Rhodobacterales TaxID=204455 RepID=UPI00119C35B1|nr:MULTISPECIES: hypothetical protein [Rhodobacterales]MBF9049919.1 hypothetical protein [Rhodobacterales bacterium HKCCD4356]NNV13542.1 hypothetical protein [Roseobacter sp. HKCCD7357]NNV16375.1 hypothetical protein [Roseobacter sp. HKCCD8768]NNV25835.1 hypothetical protein [Roseobacter sp. HKCCD8192]NNV30091.1 hypothetical protein [Roseobacter sp. HKCCD9061]